MQWVYSLPPMPLSTQVLMGECDPVPQIMPVTGSLVIRMVPLLSRHASNERLLVTTHPQYGTLPVMLLIVFDMV